MRELQPGSSADPSRTTAATAWRRSSAAFGSSSRA